MSDRSREADGVKDGSTTDHDHVTATVEVRMIHALEDPLENVNVVLDGLSAGNQLDVSGAAETVGVLIAERFEPINQIRHGVRNTLVEPELDARQSITGWLDDVQQNRLVVSQYVVRKTQPMRERDGKRDVVVS